MPMKTDIQIARECEMLPIGEVAEKFGIDCEGLEFYGKYKAKFDEDTYSRAVSGKRGKLVLVTAINPTPAGEGKTTVSIGLTQGLCKLGKRAMAALREPSLGPCMGIKGGAAGGGYSQVVPMDEINLHFTGDIHAMTTAHNLLSAMIDNHIHQGNELKIDPKRVVWKRVLDMNDRALREIHVGLGASANGTIRPDGFMITVASEIMALVCLAEDLADLKRRIGDIIVGYTFDGSVVYARDLKAAGAMTVLLKDAIKPNLVQTLEGTPVVLHGGPFANIAHGCNSVRATKLALGLSDITVTEAGFGADLGAQKFLDIKCRLSGLAPDAIVIVATIRALKYNGGANLADLKNEDIAALERGACNLKGHIENMQRYGVPVVVTLNRFESDTDGEIGAVRKICSEFDAGFALCEGFAKGGAGATDLAKVVLEALEKPAKFELLYPNEMGIREKIEVTCREIYGAGGVSFTADAVAEIEKAEKLGLRHFPVCIAKTQYSFSDDMKKLGRPTGFEVTIREIRICNGAGFIVALAGNVMTMPGLPKRPAAENIDIDSDGNIEGLF